MTNLENYWKTARRTPSICDTFYWHCFDPHPVGCIGLRCWHLCCYTFVVHLPLEHCIKF